MCFAWLLFAYYRSGQRKSPHQSQVFLPSVLTAYRGIFRRSDVVVGTAGRLAALLRSQHLKGDTVKLFVLDEVDRLLSEGLYDQIAEVYDHLPHRKQVLSTSPLHLPYGHMRILITSNTFHHHSVAPADFIPLLLDFVFPLYLKYMGA
jgi:hypothetical protein